MEGLLNANPAIESHSYEDTGHERIIKSPEMINDVVSLVKASITNVS
jgi:hypothetical protein